jgi:hypothetical protein
LGTVPKIWRATAAILAAFDAMVLFNDFFCALCEWAIYVRLKKEKRRGRVSGAFLCKSVKKKEIHHD